MASNGTSSLVLNSMTPLASLPPTIAAQYQDLCYLDIAALAVSTKLLVLSRVQSYFIFATQVYAWDWLISLSEEHQMLRKARLGPQIAYFLSR